MSLDINLTNVQAIPIVVNANITAENNKVYHVIANATFTDPTPVEGKGYVVLLVNGTFLFSSGGGTTFSQRGTLVFRQFSSGNWYTLAHDERSYNANTFVPQTRTINGLDLSANRTLTTANIADSINKRYVTDTNLTVLGNTSGTNTGDQDLTNLVVKNSAITGATKTKITYDAKGLVTSGADATTADIADSSNKRYVTDANLTVIGNTSNTNTGDETQASILSKLGFFVSNRVAESTAVTGTTTETIIDNTTIPANTYLTGGILRLYNSKFRKVGGTGIYTIKIYIGPTANNLTGATQIGTFATTNANQVFTEVLRTFTCTTSGILGSSATASASSDLGNFSNGRQSTTVDWTVNQNIMFTVTLASTSDSVTMIGNSIKNF